MFRGGHLSAFFLGGLQVSSKGDLANWIIPGKMLGGLGAMDSVSTGAKIIVCMTHLTNKGEPKILERCTLPLSGAGVIHMLITDYVNKGEIVFFCKWFFRRCFRSKMNK
jgi:3-oxoacid CoA-transferase subunit B